MVKEEQYNNSPRERGAGERGKTQKQWESSVKTHLKNFNKQLLEIVCNEP